MQHEMFLIYFLKSLQHLKAAGHVDKSAASNWRRDNTRTSQLGLPSLSHVEMTQGCNRISHFYIC